MNSKSLKRYNMSEFLHKVIYPMDDIYSIDINNPLDWIITETILTNYNEDNKII